jgi:hypothetical protein
MIPGISNENTLSILDPEHRVEKEGEEADENQKRRERRKQRIRNRAGST